MLNGGCVTLRPMRADDWDALYAVASDPLLWEVHPAHDRWREDVFRAYFNAGIASGGALAIVDRSTGKIIGSSRYDNWKPQQDEIEIGWTFLDRAYWGRRINAEVKRLMLDHIHCFVATATFSVGEGNIRSRRAMEKVGGVLRAGTELRRMAGVDVPHVVYEIRRV